MRPLPSPAHDPEVVFDEIVETKQLAARATLTRIRPEVLAQYSTYRVGRFEQLTSGAWSEAERKALLTCFNSAVPERKKLRKEILDAAGNHCPYCGISQPKTVDHYVPKDDFPEFSILPENLVPCCWPCNTAKRVAWIEQGIRLFLHAYIDRLADDSECLTVQVVWNGGKPSFVYELIQHPSVPANLFHTVRAHAQRLDLLNSYNALAADEFYSLDPIGEELPIQELRDTILDKVEENRRDWGPLSWKAALWSAVEADATALADLHRHLTERRQRRLVLRARRHATPR